MSATRSLIFVVALVAGGCAVPGGESPSPGVTPTPGASPTASPTSPESTTTASPTAGAVCLEGEFVADGRIPVETDPASGDAAASIEDLRWAAHEGCERVVIDLSGEGDTEDVSVERVDAALLRDLGVVRVSLPGVEDVSDGATSAEFGGELAEAGYVVRSADGSHLMADVILGSRAEANVFTLDDPARVVVDLRPGGGPVPEPPPTTDQVVLLQPRPSAEGEISYPLMVEGYARTFEANVVARLLQNGEQVAEEITTATDWTEAWGHFSLMIEDGPTGQVELNVGSPSAQDGTFEGVTVELDIAE